MLALSPFVGGVLSECFLSLGRHLSYTNLLTYLPKQPVIDLLVRTDLLASTMQTRTETDLKRTWTKPARIAATVKTVDHFSRRLTSLVKPMLKEMARVVVATVLLETPSSSKVTVLPGLEALVVLDHSALIIAMDAANPSLTDTQALTKPASSPSRNVMVVVPTTGELSLTTSRARSLLTKQGLRKLLLMNLTIKAKPSKYLSSFFSPFLSPSPSPYALHDPVYLVTSRRLSPSPSWSHSMFTSLTSSTFFLPPGMMLNQSPFQRKLRKSLVK